MNNYYQVAVDFPGANSVFTYATADNYHTGDLVEVPFGKGNRSALGTIIEPSQTQALIQIDKSKIKLIKGALANSYALDDKELELYHWMAKYYHYSLGKLIFDCLPKPLKRPRKIEFIQGEDRALPFVLNPEQKGIFENIKPKLEKSFSQSYIHGVTGSGKSAVYISLIKECLAQGKSVQFLLPEINLTPQFTEMFKEFLPCKILTYHSGVTASEKYTIWKNLKEEKGPFLILGVRSSIFLPVKNLGLIVVDEEHDNSFKQTDRCPYNGRDVAIKKAQIHNCPVILGSATPSLENYSRFEKLGEESYYTLKERAGEGQFPKLVLRDITQKFNHENPAWPLLDETLDDLKAALDKGEQALVFINKLGYSSFVQCRNCSHQFLNENCGCMNNLRYFKQKNCLSCAHCDFVMPLPEQCPECGGISLINKGFGTEKVEQVLKDIFKDKVIERFDRDEIKTNKELNEKLQRFHQGKIDIFVGTQMLAKGHNFKKVNLVVVLGIDSMLSYSDFRSSEKTYQLVEQIAGRAGRYSDDAKVIIQTLNSEHPVFKYIQEHSFDGFYREELGFRELCACPPYTKIAMLYFSSRFRDRLVENIQTVAGSLNKVLEQSFPEVRLHGPAPMGIEKKANQFTWAIMLKSSEWNKLHQVISTFEQNYKAPSNLSFKIDIDPMHIL